MGKGLCPSRRHPGLDPGSRCSLQRGRRSGIPDQVRDDEQCGARMMGDLVRFPATTRRNEEPAVTLDAFLGQSNATAVRLEPTDDPRALIPASLAAVADRGILPPNSATGAAIRSPASCARAGYTGGTARGGRRAGRSDRADATLRLRRVPGRCRDRWRYPREAARHLRRRLSEDRRRPFPDLGAAAWLNPPASSIGSTPRPASPRRTSRALNARFRRGRHRGGDPDGHRGKAAR